jgi:hypothetical protein
MDRADRREAKRYMAKENAKYPAHLVRWEAKDWPEGVPPNPDILEVWRSNKYLVQISRAEHPAVLVRLSVNRTALGIQSWQDNIPWEALQEIKAQCGYAVYDAVEIYPRAGDVVNVSNMRHLFVLKNPVPFAWRK